ncbi:MAG: TIGR00730 family Rossman fold protein [Candidatus Paceibacterota bacterium]
MHTFHDERENDRVKKEEVLRTAEERIGAISEEFRRGFNFIKDYPKSVTAFGSARIKEGEPFYEKARHITGRIAKETGYAVLTGGGPGIMEAANRGAFEAGGKSLGMNITLPHEQQPNPYLTDFIDFYYFFSRKVVLSYAAEAYLFFPGGAGTMDEFFEIFTLVQTYKIDCCVPLILVGEEFWKPLDSFIRGSMQEKYKTIGKDDHHFYTITDDEDLIIEMIKNAPLRK